MANDALLARLRRWTRRTVMVALVAGNAAPAFAQARDPHAASAPDPHGATGHGAPAHGASAHGASVATTKPATAPTTAPSADVRRMLEFLASSALEGRGTGTPGSDIAAGYIAARFQSIGLQPPPGWDGYFQPFSYTTSVTVDPATSLASKNDWTKTFGAGLSLDKHFQPLTFSNEGKFDAPVVFVGYGISDKSFNYDDYAGLDVKGKVVLAMRFEPSRPNVVLTSAFPPRVEIKAVSAFTGKTDDYTENASIPVKAKLAADKGAIALILVNPATGNAADPITPFARQSQGLRASIPVIQVKKPVADAMLKAGKLGSLAEAQAKIDALAKPASVALADVSLQGDVQLKRNEKSIRNVAAVLPGKGPNAGEFIIIGAHYDHLGRGGPGSLAMFSKEIHHGADDNASGTSAMLKLAELLAANGPLDRSLLFVGFTAEEVGLIGSEYFVKNCPVELGKISAMINFDMVGRVKDDRLQIGGSGTAPSFEKILNESNAGLPLKLNLGSKGGLGPSDHMSFAKNKIPVLFFFSGIHLDYHRPSDTAEKINYVGLDQVIQLGQRVITAVAGMPREQYVATHDSSGLSIMGSGPGAGSASSGNRASLGVMPDYSDDTIKGIRITGTSPGSAAEKAGLKDGDILIGWNDGKLTNLMDLMGVLGKGKPGEKVTIKLLRGGKEMTVEATLAERKG